MRGIKKRLIALSVLGAVLIGGTVPASANEMSAFPQQSTAAYSTSYARAIQVMLVNYKSLTRSYILNSGGVDGIYGKGVSDGVKAFQSSRGIGVDGICGANTWNNFRATLTQISIDQNYRIFRGNSPYFANQYNMRQYDYYGGNWYTYWSGWYYVG
ncbi:MAG TPA: peptidoglycan-binding protein [Candidatus Pullilachnospira intestinigallinarum]|nr:peptidoglycan-binding protein [Candidatus Pullilachnospira intestinigallinarum]